MKGRPTGRLTSEAATATRGSEKSMRRCSHLTNGPPWNGFQFAGIPYLWYVGWSLPTAKALLGLSSASRCKDPVEIVHKKTPNASECVCICMCVFSGKLYHGEGVLPKCHKLQEA